MSRERETMHPTLQRCKVIWERFARACAQGDTLTMHTSRNKMQGAMTKAIDAHSPSIELDEDDIDIYIS